MSGGRLNRDTAVEISIRSALTGSSGSSMALPAAITKLGQFAQDPVEPLEQRRAGHDASLRIERLLALHRIMGIQHRRVAPRITPVDAVQARDGSAHAIEIDRRPIAPLLCGQLIIDLDLAGREQPGLGRLHRIGGEVGQLHDIRHPGDAVDRGFYELDPRRRLVVVQADAAMGADGRNPVVSSVSSHSRNRAFVDSSSIGGNLRESSFCSRCPSSALHAATLAVAGTLASSAMRGAGSPPDRTPSGRPPITTSARPRRGLGGHPSVLVSGGLQRGHHRFA